MGKIITMKQQVYDILRQRIADGTYHHGERLQENDVASDLSVSRSPVREALKQLVLEGILEETPNKGASIRQFSEKQILDIYATKMLIECYAIDFLASYPQAFPLERLKQVKENIHQLDGQEIDYLLEPKVNPHNVYVEGTGNGYLIDVFRRANFCTTSYHRALFAGDNYGINMQQHLDIIDALLAFDFPKAKELLVQHLLNSQEIICKAISEGFV